MDTGNFILCAKRENIYVDIAKEIETRFDNSNYELERPSPKKIKKLLD